MSLEIFKSRYACRNFTAQTLPEATLREILEAARMAPSSLGLEPWEFYVATEPAKKIQLGEIANNQNHVKHCAAIIVIVSRLDFASTVEEKIRARDISEEEKQKRINAYKPWLEGMDPAAGLAYVREQAHIALGAILYAAKALGVDSCAIGGFDKEKLESYLGLDTRSRHATVMIALGKSADETPPRKVRMAFEEAVRFI